MGLQFFKNKTNKANGDDLNGDVLIAGVSASSPAQSIKIPMFPGTDLGVGASGPSVLLVQQAINKIAPDHPGRLWILSEDGKFGNTTRDAVYTFQSISGFPITGVVNEATWYSLMKRAYGVTPGPTPPLETQPFPGTNLSVGASGPNVLLAQQAINKIAPNHPGRLWKLTEDGKFGNMTRDAVYAFQSIFSFPVTGVVNQATWDKLMREFANVSRNSGQKLVRRDGGTAGNYLADKSDGQTASIL